LGSPPYAWTMVLWVFGGHATYFPSGIALASMWDTAIVRKVGQGIGKEVRGKGRNIILF